MDGKKRKIERRDLEELLKEKGRKANGKRSASESVPRPKGKGKCAGSR